MNLSENLKKIRKEHNLSQEQLAEKIGVSRQAVSKWESNLAYPEMDKVIELCKMFNLNIDDLLNQDVNKLNKNKSKIDISKYINDFLDSITKTINMFTSMSFKEKLKCIFEQIVIIIILLCIFSIIAIIGSNILNGILDLLPYRMSDFGDFLKIVSIISYLIVCTLLSFIIIFHLFKERYLKYYISVDKNDDEFDDFVDNKDINYLPNKKERIIIRNPKNYNFNFTNGLIKCLLVIIKFLAIYLLILLCLSLLLLTILIPISFIFIKTGILFIGSIISIISCVIMNAIFIIIIYKFVINKGFNKNLYAIIFISSLVALGIGMGLMITSISEFEFIENLDSKYYITKEFNYKMKDNIFISEHISRVKYIESNNNDIKIVTRASEFYTIDIYEDDDYYYIDKHINNNNIKPIKKIISDINNKKVINYDAFDITVYTTKENIDKLKENRKNYFSTINEYYFSKEIASLQESLLKNNDEINKLKSEIELKNATIYNLEEKINELTRKSDELDKNSN